MTERKDGGLAFPQPVEIQGRGMTLRDYFAAAVLPGIIAHAKNDATASAVTMSNGGTISRSNYVNTAYQYADAMLAERDK